MSRTKRIVSHLLAEMLQQKLWTLTSLIKCGLHTTPTPLTWHKKRLPCPPPQRPPLLSCGALLSWQKCGLLCIIPTRRHIGPTPLPLHWTSPSKCRSATPAPHYLFHTAHRFPSINYHQTPELALVVEIFCIRAVSLVNMSSAFRKTQNPDKPQIRSFPRVLPLSFVSFVHLILAIINCHYRLGVSLLTRVPMCSLHLLSCRYFLSNFLYMMLSN